MSDETALVVDFGSMFVKAGFGGDDAPRTLFPTIVGRSTSTSQPIMLGINQQEKIVGDEAMGKMGRLELEYPFHGKLEESRDSIDKVIHHTFFKELRVDPSEHSLFLASSPFEEGTADTEELMEIFMEKYKVPRFFHHTLPTLLCLVSSGKGVGVDFDGIALDVGETQSHVISIVNGRYVPESLKKNRVGGRNVTEHLIQLLKEQDNISSSYDFTKYTWQYEIIRRVKELHCYISKDINSISEEGKEDVVEYELADGSKIHIPKSKLFAAPEVIFKPQSASLYNELGIAELIQETIQSCPYDCNKEEMYKNIHVYGGSTMFPGFVERLEKELKDCGASNFPIKISASPERKFSTWIGGSILTSLDAFSASRYCSKAAYDEMGKQNAAREYFANTHEKLFVNVNTK